MTLRTRPPSLSRQLFVLAIALVMGAIELLALWRSRWTFRADQEIRY